MENLNVELVKKIYQDAGEKSHLVIMKDWEMDEWFDQFSDKSNFRDKLFTEEEFFRRAEYFMDTEEEDTYFSINSFRHKKKTSTDIWHLNAFVLDFDYYKIEKYKDLTAEQMYNEVLSKELTVDPTAVVDSGRGLYIIYSFQHCPRAMNKTYQSIYKTFLTKFEKFGMDPKAMNLTQVVRLPGTLNTKSFTPVKVINFKDTSYKISDFFQLFPYTQEQVQKYKIKIREKRKAKSKGYEATVEELARRMTFRKQQSDEMFDDFKELIKLRNESGEVEGYREMLIYTARRRVQWHKGRIDEELDVAHALNQLFDQPMEDKEVITTCKPRGVTRCAKIDTIIKKLQITEAEQSKLKVLQTKAIKDSRYHKKKRVIKLLNITPAERKKLERRTKVARLKNEGLKNTKIADILEVNKSTITRDLKYINEHAWKFKKKLQDAMDELKVNIHKEIFTRHTQYSEQLQLREWLKYSEEMLN